MKPRLPDSASRLLMVSAVVFLGIAVAGACNIPVFRFALDRWRPDRYELVLLHDEPLAEEDRRLLEKLQEYTDRPDCPANVNLTRVDLSRKHDGAWDKLAKQAPRPCLVLRFPDAADIAAPIWTGAFSGETVRSILDSPARRRIAKQIWAGTSAVWLLLESGDPKKDSAALATLKAGLVKLERSLKLPDITTAPQDKLLNPRGPKVRLEFSVLSVSRADAAEDMLVRMLLQTEEGLHERREPMVFPVFGRGIVLHALVGKGITERNIGESAAFLTGACSCEVKRLNPGVDLLITADWETGTDPESLHVATRAIDLTPHAPPASAGSMPLVRNTTLALLGAVAILALLARRRALRRTQVRQP
ncbi:MAG: hypothetical protein FJ271_12625 [Planctomycetes bacterium]|nr:hypothetical protein [Planctomycetota bacterium]